MLGFPLSIDRYLSPGPFLHGVLTDGWWSSWCIWMETPYIGCQQINRGDSHLCMQASSCGWDDGRVRQIIGLHKFEGVESSTVREGKTRGSKRAGEDRRDLVDRSVQQLRSSGSSRSWVHLTERNYIHEILIGENEGTMNV